MAAGPRGILTPLGMLRLLPFLFWHRHAVVQPLLERLIVHHPSSKIGMEGFCWGGRYASTANPLLDATVACHPAMVAFPAEVEAVTKPIVLAVVKGDRLFDIDKADRSRDIFARKQLPSQVELYEGVTHGFSVRADLSDPQKKAAKEKVTEQALSWFDLYMR